MTRALLVLVLATGCASSALLDSYRGFHARAGAEWLRYVEADPSLEPDDKRARRLLFDAAARVIDEASDD